MSMLKMFTCLSLSRHRMFSTSRTPLVYFSMYVSPSKVSSLSPRAAIKASVSRSSGSSDACPHTQNRWVCIQKVILRVLCEVCTFGMLDTISYVTPHECRTFFKDILLFRLWVKLYNTQTLINTSFICCSSKYMWCDITPVCCRCWRRFSCAGPAPLRPGGWAALWLSLSDRSVHSALWRGSDGRSRGWTNPTNTQLTPVIFQLMMS